MKKIIGRSKDNGGGPQCLPVDAYCGIGANYNLKCCAGFTCQDAGNGRGSGPGEDKLCLN
ncbi:MAG: hypothetical protein JST21_12885 [Bacteroidetes bacterium]|nr:hypothetical protein [Bacteroidota bacterium]